MDRSKRAIERQQAVVETLRRQLQFELLVLQRLVRSGERADASPGILREVLDRAARRQVEVLLGEASETCPAD